MGEFKSGFVTVVGRTNVGKSSIINRIVGEKVSAVTSKTQTTRKNIKAIVNRTNSQIIFTDTPGVHKAKSKLSEVMNESAMKSIPEVDIIVYVIDSTSSKVDEKTLTKIKEANKNTILVINKIDLITPSRLAEIVNEYKDLYEFSAIVPVSASNNKNIEELICEIERNLKVGPAYYDIDEYTDQTLRELAEETIREKALKLLQDEVPHGIYIEVTKMKKRKTQKEEKIFDIDATIYCLKDSHKGIIIGKQGSMLKRIGTYAREDLEKMLGDKINLKLWVKVKEDWINDLKMVNKFKSDEG